MRPLHAMIVVLLAIIFGMTIWVYPALPASVVSHWNAAGEADGSLPKIWGAWLIPIIASGFTAMMIVIPRIDPLKNNYGKFRSYYDGFIVIFLVFFLVVQVQVLLWSLGFHISPNRTFPIIFSLLFLYTGYLLDHTEPNWFVGIRTPWTLSSDLVWKKTHKLGGLLFKVAGVIVLLGVIFPAYTLWFVLVPAIAVSAVTVVYSYVAYQRIVPG